MKDDDPKKRIRELERGLADVTRPPQSAPPYSGNAPFVRDPTWGVGFQPPRRKSRFALVLALVVLGVLVPTIGSVIAFHAASNAGRSTSGATVSSTDPSAVPQGASCEWAALRRAGRSRATTAS
jgi:hypothetical protein